MVPDQTTQVGTRMPPSQWSLLAPAKLSVEGAVGQGASVVGGKDDEGVLCDAQFLDGVEELADFVVHVLDEGDVGGALLVELWLAFLHFLQPIFRWLDGKMRRVVGEVEEEGFLSIGRLFLYVVDAPSSKHLGGVALGFSPPPCCDASS